MITKFSLFYFLRAAHPQIPLTHATVLHISVKWYYYLASLCCRWHTHPTRCLTTSVLYSGHVWTVTVINWWPTTVTSLSHWPST